jgi:hypothetical protein
LEAHPRSICIRSRRIELLPHEQEDLMEGESQASFRQRFMQKAKDAEEKARRLEPGPERDALLRQLSVACHIEEWISSTGLQPPH